MLLYFPGTKKFLAPTLLQDRYPSINPYWGGADALFCKGTTIGSFSTAIAEIKNVPLEDYTQTYDNIESKARLNPGNDTLLIDMRQFYAGYSAAPYRTNFTLGSADDQKEMLKSMVKFGTNSENIVTSDLQNQDFESYSDNKPFILHAVVKSTELLENAGNKLLIKVGEFIGPQEEMYQEKPRQLPVQLAFPHALDRKIDFVIPDGYTVKNIGDLAINRTMADHGDTLACFISSYKLEGNTIKISVQEHYLRISYPLSQFEEFKKVINASADFNKIVLVLEKKYDQRTCCGIIQVNSYF